MRRLCFSLPFKIKSLLSVLCALLLLLQAMSVRADDWLGSSSPSTAFQSLPVKPFNWDQPEKAALAEAMSQWAIQTLRDNQAKVGVVARQGAYVTRFFDRTGMTHSGFVFQDPETGEWITYSLYSDTENEQKTALLWRQSLKDFFYGQRSSREEALLLIPEPGLQEKMLQRLHAQPFQSLLPENHRYSLVAPLTSPISFNCTKWVVLNLYAAREGTDDIPALLGVMRQEYPVRTMRPRFLSRWVLKRKRDVNWEELHPPGVVRTVTVDSLYHSDLFEKHFLYSGKKEFRGLKADKFTPIDSPNKH